MDANTKDLINLFLPIITLVIGGIMTLITSISVNKLNFSNNSKKEEINKLKSTLCEVKVLKNKFVTYVEQINKILILSSNEKNKEDFLSYSYQKIVDLVTVSKFDSVIENLIKTRFYDEAEKLSKLKPIYQTLQFIKIEFYDNFDIEKNLFKPMKENMEEIKKEADNISDKITKKIKPFPKKWKDASKIEKILFGIIIGEIALISGLLIFVLSNQIELKNIIEGIKETANTVYWIK